MHVPIRLEGALGGEAFVSSGRSDGGVPIHVSLWQGLGRVCILWQDSGRAASGGAMGTIASLLLPWGRRQDAFGR
jgi:hypothetical protein